MHTACYEWVAKVVTAHELRAKLTLEVGSQIVNGTVRDHFCGTYVGVDAYDGPGVDWIMDAETLDFVAQSYDVVVSTEMLEHVLRPWKCVAEMARVLKDGGYLILTARGYDERGCWEPHGFPEDHWRFGASTLGILAEDVGLVVLEQIPDPEGPGYFLLARKP
jgi:SAM-dependent methyltransferase